MAHYRLYTLDLAGSIVDGQDREFSTDDAALAAAAEQAGRNGVAVWQGVRHVGSIGPGSRAAAPHRGDPQGSLRRH